MTDPGSILCDITHLLPYLRLLKLFLVRGGCAVVAWLPYMNTSATKHG
jgi:hypothetical protein